jgi:hypothetical protein
LGQPWSVANNYGTIRFDAAQTFASTSEIAAAAAQFGKGYWICIGASDRNSQLTLAIGTNNLGSQVLAGYGIAWAQMVNAGQSDA